MKIDTSVLGENIMKQSREKEAILQELKKSGCRITNQRKILIDAILENECASCKEIYYEATKKDSKIGIATVYRMVKTLEDIGAINRKNQFRVFFDPYLKEGYL